MTTKQSLFGELDFKLVASDPDFKEDSVREVIISPILKALGYTDATIVRSKRLQHPYLKIGTGKKRPISLIPDYSLKVEQSFAWVLDAKSPIININEENNIEQVYSYASHPDIRSTYFALCNGLFFSVYKREATNSPILYFRVEEIDNYWEFLKKYLSPESFQLGKSVTYEQVGGILNVVDSFNYSTRPFLKAIQPKRQSAKRHKGVHGYFTRQVWNVVQEYIRNFSQKGDIVLDPFGGSGVTAIEALVTGRHAIHIDLNPMSAFIVNSLTSPCKISELIDAFNTVKALYLKNEPNTAIKIDKALKKYKYPVGLALPKGSDVKTIEELFTSKQLAQLAYLKHLLSNIKDSAIKNSLLLTFSSALYKLNLTYQEPTNSTDGGGNSGVFAYYRYRIAPRAADLSVIDVFENRFKKIIDAKKEINSQTTNPTTVSLKAVKGSATNLDFINDASIDYIYTDPPYGKKIAYLDLSTMWNAWLDLPVDEKDFQHEAIEGGDHNKSKKEYNRLIAESIHEMYRVLKYDRWLSFVFAHKDPEFWHLIIETAESCGFEYVGAVAQSNGQVSFKKRQHPFTVLSGQLIINFRKVRNPKAILKANLGMNIAEIVIQTIEGMIAKNSGASIEQINDELIIKGLELGFLDLLKSQYTDLTPLLTENFDYDKETKQYIIRKDTKFKTHIDVKLRVKYYLLSYLRRMEREKTPPHFDDLVLYILPLLKNGTTPETQTILSVLEDIGERVGKDSWRLKMQRTLFD